MYGCMVTLTLISREHSTTLILLYLQLLSFSFSQSRKHANKVRLYYMLHPVDGGCPAKKLRTDNVSPVWIIHLLVHPAAHSPMVSVITDKHAHINPQLASLVWKPLFLMDFPAFPSTSVGPPTPHSGSEWLTDKQQCHISRPMNNSTVTLLQLDAKGFQPVIKPKDTLWGAWPPRPSLSCKLEVHDVFDRCNYIACLSLFNKCLGGDVWRLVCVAFLFLYEGDW